MKKHMTAVTGAFLIYFIGKAVYLWIFSIIFILAGMYLLLFSTDEFEASIEPSKSTLLAILALIIGVSSRPGRKK